MTCPTYTPEQIHGAVLAIVSHLDGCDPTDPDAMESLRFVYDIVAGLAGPGAVYVGLLIAQQRPDLTRRIGNFLASWSGLPLDRLPAEEGNGDS